MSITASRLRAVSLPRPVAVLRQRWVTAGATRTSTYLLLVTAVAVLNVIGLVMVLSASYVTSLDDKGSAWWFFERQLVWSAMGIAAFAACSRLDYRLWRRWAPPLVGIAIVLLVLVLVPGVGIWVDGSRRWLGAGWLRFQPSELAKLALLVYAADLLTRRARLVGDWRCVLRPLVLVCGIMSVLVMREPDLDTTMIFAVIMGSVILFGGVPWRQIGATAAVGVMLVATFAIVVPWRRSRMLTFLHPTADPSNTGYQIVQSLIAVASGGWTGVGLGAGRAKWRFLPAAHTDFIFAVIGEELGLVGALLVVGLFLAFAVLGVRAALRAPDRFGLLLAGGITAWIVGQAVLNLGMVVGLLPVSGNTLPFVSAGGSSLVFCMAGAGILGNVARQSRT